MATVRVVGARVATVLESNTDAHTSIVIPARASVSDSINVLMNAEALASIAMPARSSASSCIDTLMNNEALTGFVPKGHP